MVTEEEEMRVFLEARRVVKIKQALKAQHAILSKLLGGSGLLCVPSARRMGRCTSE